MKAFQIQAPENSREEISNSIEDLSEISSRFCANELDQRQILDAYHSRLKQMNATLLATEYTGLLDLLKIFIEGVESLVDSGRELNSGECRFLLQFPNLLIEYFSLPLSKLPGKLLVRFFKNPDWVRPISDSEEDVIYNQICQQTERVDYRNKKKPGFIDEEINRPLENECLVDDKLNDTIDSDQTTNDTEIVLEELYVESQGQKISHQQLKHQEIEKADLNELLEVLPVEDELKAADSADETQLEDILDNTVSIGSDFTTEDHVNDTDHIQLLDIIDDVQKEARESARDEDSENVDLMDFLVQSEGSIDDNLETTAADRNENGSVSEEITLDIFNTIDESLIDSEQDTSESVAIDLSELIGNDIAAGSEHNHVVSENSYQENIVASESINSEELHNGCTVDENQQLLIDLVRAELAEILEDRDNDFNTLKNENDQDTKQHLLLNYAEQAENISHAVELIGLEGLSQSSHFISDNLSCLANDAENFNQQQYQLLYDWPEKLFEYLQTINRHVEGDKLIEFLILDCWPIKLEDESGKRILSLLNNPVLEKEEKVQRQTVATHDDVTLALPDDVNQELLEGLLQDLPEQTEEFSSAIEHYKQSGNKHDIETAQRIAHTLKGAANVVGVKGIASLTHHLEDILEYLSSKNQSPEAGLLQVLMNASDCLQAMAESLLGLDSEPEESIDVLQSILDWANRFDNGDVAVTTEDKISEQNTIASSDIEDKQSGPVDISGKSTSNELTNEPGPETSVSVNAKPSDNMLRIPVSLADELLRIAGETLISNTQIEDKINSSLKRQESFALQSSQIQQVSFDLEHLIDIQGITSTFTANEHDDDFDSLEMDKFHELHGVSRRLVEISADSMQLSQVLKNELNELKNLVIDQDKLQKTNQELVLRTRMVPVKSIVPRLKRGVRQACRLTSKNVDLHFYDNDTYMDSEVLNEMVEALMHVLRNAVDHGIEDESVRHETGKSLTGSISIKSIRDGNTVVIEIADDGKGLDEEKIIQKALAKDLIASDHELLQEDIYRLILEPGFSTRDDVTQTSGRGIGLDVVNNKVRTLKGSIAIESAKGQGSVFKISLPISSFSTHSLMVRVRQYIYAISNRGVEEILYPGSGEIREIAGRLYYHIEGESYDATLIDDLLNLGPDRRNIERSERPVIIVKDDAGKRHAVLLQAVLDSRDVVVKSTGQYLPDIHGVIGATVLGDGSVAPVIDLPDLFRSNTAILKSGVSASQQSMQSSRSMPYALVVDDSLSARRSLQQFAEDLGMNTREARDGMEAVAIIRSKIPDIVLVDMEMPRMNGLELTAHIRADEKTAHIPVIMISSRSSEKHKALAAAKGVNDFIVKPFDEDMLAAKINQLLARENV